MSYLVRADLQVSIPPAFILEALDDDGDGIEDAGLYDALAEAIDAEIDGYLSRRYALPIETTPPSLRAGARDLAGETIYKRRGVPAEANPFAAAAGNFRTWLADVAGGKAQLVTGQPAAKPPISIISTPAGTVPNSRLNG